MKTEMGEYIVGAYLKLIEGCDVVDYNVRPPGGGLAGLSEFDVIGLRFKDRRAIMCEVTTHIRGLLYKDNKTSVERIAKKHERQKEYADEHLLPIFDVIRYQFWSPVVPVGYLTTHLAEIDSLELVINTEYARRVEELQLLAKKLKNDTGNPFFRALQIIGHLRRHG